MEPFTRENGYLVMALDACERRTLPQNSDGPVKQEVLDGLRPVPPLATPGARWECLTAVAFSAR